MRAILLYLAVCTVPGVAWADFTGRVVNVHDGDTLTVLMQRKQIRVRLDGIDAPELRHALGKRSRQSLTELCGGKVANVAARGKDRYGRTIGRVSCVGLEANAEQVRRGMAWVYVRYVSKGSSLFRLEGDARAMKPGLWMEPKAMAPWTWRKERRTRKTTKTTAMPDHRR